MTPVMFTSVKKTTLVLDADRFIAAETIGTKRKATRIYIDALASPNHRTIYFDVIETPLQVYDVLRASREADEDEAEEDDENTIACPKCGEDDDLCLLEDHLDDEEEPHRVFRCDSCGEEWQENEGVEGES